MFSLHIMFTVVCAVGLLSVITVTARIMVNNINKLNMMTTSTSSQNTDLSIACQLPVQ